MSTTSVQLSSIEAPRNRTGDQDLTVTASTTTDHAAATNLIDSGAPDGGQGWWVVAGCAVLSWWYLGYSYCWGVFQAALVDNEVSKPSTLAFVGSLSTGCISVFAIANSRIIRKVGSRPIAILGILLLGFGQVLTGFATENVGGLFVTAGFTVGVGTSLCHMSVWVTPAQYFKTKRGIANGIISASGGIGGGVLSFAVNALIDRVGVAWTFRIIGFMALATGLPAAWFVKERVPIRNTVTVEWRLFQDPRFVFLFVATGLAIFPLFVPPFFLPLYTKALGFSSTTGAGFVAAFNFSSACGRLLCGFGSDLIGPLNTMIVSLLLSALSMLVLWPFSTSLGSVIVFMIINGASNGGFFATTPTVVGNTFGSARISIIMGMMITGWLGGYLFGAPIAGYILSSYEGPGKAYKHVAAYHPAIYYAGSMALGSVVLATSLKLLLNKKFFAKL